ncbi:MAG: phosphotransferase [Proteobacteria bacterium]|nr:phosphotransferase [Pseudomonadota bacterium]
MPQADPFAVIETEAPQLDASEVLQLVREHYGLEARLEALLSERDQNFLLRCDDGRQFVVKIVNAAEDPLATDFQSQALLYLEAHLANNDCPINVPRILRTTGGRTHLPVTSAGAQHVMRVITYLAGIPLGNTPASPVLCRRLGVCLAHLGRALHGFDHPGSDHGLLWDMQQALQLRRILEHVSDRDLRRHIAQTLDDFEAHALSQFKDARSQVIHSDLNPENVLIDPEDRSSITGVIDFGDMLKAPLIVDVAIGASYLRATVGNPLAGIAEFLVGYHSVTPLEISEIDMLFDLIKTRLATSISILSWRATLRGADDPYLTGSVASASSAAEFLKILRELPRENVQQTFRQICASTQSLT